MAEKVQKLFTYKDKPLVRSGNTLYYGDLNDPYVVIMTITDSKPFEDLNLPCKVTVQLMLTDPEVRAKDRFQKRSEKDSLWAALDIGEIWLRRALSESQQNG